MTSYEITWEPLYDLPYNVLPPAVDSQAERLYHLVRSEPAQAVPELEGWIERYPDVAKLANYLALAYQSIGDKAQAERVIRENYRRHPDYLFAKLNYADDCLRNGRLAEIPIIFNNQYDLSLLYPQRKRFHITELVEFVGFMGRYFLAKGDREQARAYLEMLREVAPDYPTTRDLGRRLAHPILARIVGKAQEVLRRGSRRGK